MNRTREPDSTSAAYDLDKLRRLCQERTTLTQASTRSHLVIIYANRVAMHCILAGRAIPHNRLIAVRTDARQNVQGQVETD